METRTLAPGAKITEPGVWDLTMDQYHGQPTDGPSISSSGLRTIWADSPAHYWIESSLNPNRPAAEERAHFSLGRAAHHLLFLGRKGFDEEFVTRPAQWSDWRTKEAKEWKARAILDGKTVLTETDLEHITGMARSLSSHPVVKAGILDGAVERSLLFKDQTGVWLKSRPDCIPTASGDFADLKTTISVATESLQRSIEDFHYAMQGALVGMASKAVLSIEMQSFTLVFVEKAPPYCVRVVTLTPEDLLRGEMQLRAAIDIFAGCVESGEWPGPGGHQQDAEFLPMREFTRKRIDEQLELLKADAPRQLHAAE
jgi:hypothetical protein